MTSKITLLLLTLTCGLAAFTAPAFANYIIEKEPKIQGKEGKFENLNEKKEKVGAFTCEKEEGKVTQTGEVSELQQLETNTGCSGTAGGEKVKMEFTEGTKLRISSGKEIEKEGEHRQWDARERVSASQITYRSSAGQCAVRIAPAQVQGTWRNLGGGQSTFTYQAQRTGTVNAGAANELACRHIGLARKYTFRRRARFTYRRITHS